MSLRTLKRRLRDFGLRRNGNMNEDVQERIREVIENEISNGSGASLGYRSMWHLLRLQYHVHVPRRVVAQVLHEVDPEGVQQSIYIYSTLLYSQLLDMSYSAI